MIRGASKFKALINAATCGANYRNTIVLPGLTQLRSLSSAAAQISDEDVLPPNLTFDRRSSFAPKEKSFFVPLDEVNEESDDDFDGEESGYESEDLDEDFKVSDSEDEGPVYVVPLPDRLKADVHSVDGSVTGSLWLDSSVFGADPIRVDLIKQSVDYIRNKIRGRRKAKSKTISEVSGSGRKVRQQKGTGRARAGHSRPAHWRGGAKAHGPKNTVDYGDVKMNKKARRLAMVSTLSQKLKEGNFILLDNLKLESHKTKHLANLLENSHGIGKDGASALVLDHYLEPEDDADENSFDASYHGIPINLWVASGNIYKIKVQSQRYANVYDILKKEKLIMTLGALGEIEARLKD
jgi:large subunit ribosomal protein L4